MFDLYFENWWEVQTTFTEELKNEIRSICETFYITGKSAGVDLVVEKLN